MKKRKCPHCKKEFKNMASYYHIYFNDLNKIEITLHCPFCQEEIDLSYLLQVILSSYLSK